MLSALSRFVDASTILRNPSQYSASVTFNPTSHASLLKNKNLASYAFHGSILKSLQYDPARRNFVVRNNITPPGAPLPSGSPPHSLRNWVVGIVLTLILPFFIHKRSWIPLKKLDTMMETTEQVMETIEAVAKGADEIIDEFTDDLPQNSKLKETMEAIDEVVEEVAKRAHVANEIIHKVEETEEKLKSSILHGVKEDKASIRVLEEEKVNFNPTTKCSK